MSETESPFSSRFLHDSAAECLAAGCGTCAPNSDLPAGQVGGTGAGGTETPPAPLSTPADLAEWICATLDYLVLDGLRPSCLDEYVSKPTLARKAKDKARELARRAS